MLSKLGLQHRQQLGHAKKFFWAVFRSNLCATYKTTITDTMSITGGIISTSAKKLCGHEWKSMLHRFQKHYIQVAPDQSSTPDCLDYIFLHTVAVVGHVIWCKIHCTISSRMSVYCIFKEALTSGVSECRPQQDPRRQCGLWRVSQNIMFVQVCETGAS